MGRRPPKGKLPKFIKNPETYRYDVMGTEIKYRHERIRKAYAKDHFSRGKPKEYYLYDYYEDPMTYPKDLPIEVVYRVYNTETKKFVQSTNTYVFSRLKAAQTFLNKQDNKDLLEIVPCHVIPISPVPNKKLPSLSKPDKENPMTGWIRAGKQRSKIKKEKLIKDIDKISEEIEENLNAIKGIHHIEPQETQEPASNENNDNTKEHKAIMPKGYLCSCGVYNKYTAWVYAHWYEGIRHTCKCGKKNTICEGKVIE